jgi:hypothetical protein
MPRDLERYDSIFSTELCRKNHTDQVHQYQQVALILGIRWPFSERTLNITTIKNYFNLDDIISFNIPNRMEIYEESIHFLSMTAMTMFLSSIYM